MNKARLISLGKQYWSHGVLGVAILLALFAWKARRSQHTHTYHQKTFLTAAQVAEHFYRGEPLTESLCTTLERSVEEHPELHSKYDSLLAMAYVAQQDSAKGLVYAQSALAHTEQTLPPLYQRYARTSLKMIQQDYASAYEEALSLHETLMSHEPSTLSALNLLRLVNLEKRLGMAPHHWEALKAHPEYPSLAARFRAGRYSLEEWYTQT